MLAIDLTSSLSRLARAFGVLGLAASLAAQAPTYHATLESLPDPALAQVSDDVLLSLPGVADDFVIGGGGQFVELADGTARWTGRLISRSSLYTALLVDLVFSGRVEPGQAGYPPPGSPQLGLKPAAYVPNGSIDPGAFVYYTQASGTLTGSSNLAGAVLDLQANGPIQIGYGANNRNGALGVQASFQVTVLQQPAVPFGNVGPADFAIDLLAERGDAVTHPVYDAALAALPASRAMVIPWVADDYVFAPAGSFVEHDDGTASLQGRLLRLQQLDDAWDVVLQFSARVDPGQAAYPPAGSPVLSMQPSAYVANGGTIDPGHWHYYGQATGTLTGIGYNQGAVIALQQSSPLQVGAGANQFDSFFGTFASFQPTVLSHPTGRTLVIGGDLVMHGLCQVFPELPRPTLDVPPSTYTLPTLTDQPILLSGNDLAWTELVGVGSHLLPPGDAGDWYAGYFRILDNQHLELHVRPGLAPGTYDLSTFTPSWRSNVLSIALSAPTTPVLYGESAVQNPDTLHLLMHQGTIPGPAMAAVAMSGSLVPSTIGNAVTLDIGNQGQGLLVIPGTFLHDPTTGIAEFDLGPVPAWYTGFTSHFQAVVVDLANPQLPLPTTNVWSVTF